MVAASQRMLFPRSSTVVQPTLQASGVEFEMVYAPESEREFEHVDWVGPHRVLVTLKEYVGTDPACCLGPCLYVSQSHAFQWHEGMNRYFPLRNARFRPNDGSAAE